MPLARRSRREARAAHDLLVHDLRRVRATHGDASEVSQRSSAVIRSSIVAENHDVGIFIGASDTVIEGSVVRDTMFPPAGLGSARGISLGFRPEAPDERSVVAVRGSIIERHPDLGIVSQNSAIELDGVLVRDALPNEAGTCGIVGDLSSTAMIRSSRVERYAGCGILIDGSDATIEATLVTDTQPRSDGTFGDGMVFDVHDRGASASVLGSRVENSSRAGMANFNSSVSMGNTHFECNTIALNGESSGDQSDEWHDLTGNLCGCAGAYSACKVISTALEAPAPVTPDEPQPDS